MCGCLLIPSASGWSYGAESPCVWVVVVVPGGGGGGAESCVHVVDHLWMLLVGRKAHSPKDVRERDGRMRIRSTILTCVLIAIPASYPAASRSLTASALVREVRPLRTSCTYAQGTGSYWASL